MLTIKVKYCGGCNPEINRVGLVESLKEEIEKKGLRVNFVGQDTENADLLLLVNGCRHACLEEQYLPFENGQGVISIEGEALNGEHIPQEAIPAILAEKIIDLAQGNDKN